MKSFQCLLMICLKPCIKENGVRTCGSSGWNIKRVVVIDVERWSDGACQSQEITLAESKENRRAVFLFRVNTELPFAR